MKQTHLDYITFIQNIIQSIYEYSTAKRVTFIRNILNDNLEDMKEKKREKSDRSKKEDMKKRCEGSLEEEERELVHGATWW